MADYNLEGPRWGAGAIGTFGGVITWSLDPTAVPLGSVIAEAFADWASKANIGFEEVNATAGADITFAQATIDGSDGVLGDTDYFYVGTAMKAADITFDSDEAWHMSGSATVSRDGINLFTVALHEIGHALGLDHYNDAPAVMNATLDLDVTDLTTSDIDGIRALYGFAQTSSDPLIDPSYYLGTYSDLAKADVDPVAHYDTYGWKEGRNPDAFFSTAGYLDSNVDVKASGMNPLAHYENYGWKEGRDPSALFSTTLYLKDNPDVAAAGMDPLEHYLDYGKAEGRAAPAAVGHGDEIDAFDPHYYLLANPDVAAVADTTANPDQFALQHYDQYGWKEGRNPSAFFDTDYYLAHNPDVAAAGVDPLLHYEQFGWHEGRNASASFDTDAYLAANPDVKAAGMDPLSHFLTYGVWEGRSA